MIPWEVINHFSPTEFVDDVNLAEAKLIIALDEFREILGKPIHPSPVRGSLARTDPAAAYSRHYAVNRLSDAIDVFCELPPAIVWHHAVACGLWGGIGIYFDTMYEGQPHTMFHLDQRPKPLHGPVIWARESGDYTKPMQNNIDMRVLYRVAGERRI